MCTEAVGPPRLLLGRGGGRGRQALIHSDIQVVQTNPFNTTVHISLNVGTGAKVRRAARSSNYTDSAARVASRA